MLVLVLMLMSMPYVARFSGFFCFVFCFTLCLFTLCYILFRIDWLINLLIRYTSDERNDGAIILNRVINILRQVKDMLCCQDSNGSTSYQAGKIFTGMHEGPKFNIQREHLEFLVEQGFNNPIIAGILGVSLKTIERRQQEYGIRQRSTYSTISNQDLDNIIDNILVDFPETGYKRMTGFLRSRGVVVQQSRIREAMRRVNRAVARALIGGCIFIYSGSARLVSFEIN